METLPIDAVLPDLVARLAAAGAVVLRAPTGAGKTTRVPPAVVANGKLVFVLEPRRVAARAAARRMAAEQGSPVGEYVGYHVRFDRVAGPRTRILVVTPGVFLRLLHADPFLESAGAVVFDEYHERGIESDLALGMVKLVRESVRPDLRVVVMSATLDPGPIAAYLGNCPTVTSEGRIYPVVVVYRPRRSDVRVADAVAAAVRHVLGETPGDVLAFLPGMKEIRQTAARLDSLAGVEVLPLHGDLPPEEQDRALKKLARRKVVLATNVAETSVTVDGVTAVVDSGLARQLEFDAAVGLDRLRLGPISRAAADQRAGRAGRTGPGLCVRLWDEPGHRARLEVTAPEIRRADLAPAVLHLFALGETDVAAFPWFEPPSTGAVERAVDLLTRLGAVDAGALTPLGLTLARLPTHPRLGRLLLEGAALVIPDRAALAAALIAERDPFLRVDGPPRPASATASDILDRVEALEAFARGGRSDRLHPGGARTILDARDQLLRSLRGENVRTGRAEDKDAALLRAVFAAFPDRLARRRGKGDSRAVMTGGRGLILAPTSGVTEPDLFVAVDVDAGGVDSFVRVASGVERDWLPAERITSRHEVEFDPAAEKLVARKRTRYADLLLDETHGHFADEAEAARVLAAAAAANLDRVLPPPESAAGRLRIRVRCLRAWMPDLGLPAFEIAELADLLPQLCRGRRSFADLRAGPWADALRGHLSYQQATAVDREAPERLTVPGGRPVELVYEEGRPPVLAAKVQELFGLADTPRVGGGRVKVLVHLLAPNGRPQQVTDDLASFWANTYPLVRKELRGRYPKHDWPDDPLTATAGRGPKRRGV